MLYIATDGSSKGNPGPGGWGFICFDEEMDTVFESAGKSEKTTNNEMELKAFLEALLYTKKEGKLARILTDSSYVKNGATMWMHGWQKNGWITSSKEEVKNKDLWQKIYKVYADVSVQVFQVKGHAGHPANERVDLLAQGQAKPLGKVDVSDYVFPISKDSFRVDDTEKTGVKGAKKNTGKAYSYVSEISGAVQVHTNWDDCYRRVHGKKARFKKVFSKEEENELIEDWTS